MSGLTKVTLMIIIILLSCVVESLVNPFILFNHKRSVPVCILKHTGSTSRLLTEVKTILFSQDLIRLVNEDII